MKQYNYYIQLWILVDGEPRLITIPGKLPKGRLEFIALEGSNFNLQSPGIEKYSVGELNHFMRKLNNCTETQLDTIMMVHYTSRNRTIQDLRYGYKNRDDFTKIPMYDSRSEKIAGELLFKSIAPFDEEYLYADTRQDSLFMAIFYLGIRSQSIVNYEHFYYVRTSGFNTIQSMEEIAYIQELIGEAY